MTPPVLRVIEHADRDVVDPRLMTPHHLLERLPIARPGDGSWRMRTFERGVEGETLACGTGAVACALALASQTDARPPVRIWTSSGMPLDVSWEKGPSGASSIRLRGEARLVYRGILGALVSQPPTSD